MKLTFNKCGFVPFTFSITFEKVEELQAFYDVANQSSSVAICVSENQKGVSEDMIRQIFKSIRQCLQERFGPIGWGKYRLWSNPKTEAANDNDCSATV